MQFEKISQKQARLDGIYCYDDIKLPARATKFSAGYDIYSPIDFTLNPGEEIKFPTGLRIKLDEDKVLLLVPRSSIGFNYGVMLSNTIGVIDADYYNSYNEGHFWIKLSYPVYNNSNNLPLMIKKGDAVCQGIILPYFKVDDDNSTTIRNGGFGSTNT